MSIYEITHTLSEDERNTLLFLTGKMRIIKCNELTDNDLWNLKEFFGYNKPNSPALLKVIIFRDKVITKLAD